jgi:two-component system response regulator HydG
LLVPPLRERGDDILLLARSFLERFSKHTHRELTLSRALEARLRAHDWPGNVRELQNCIERMATLSTSNQLEVEDFAQPFRLGTPQSAPPASRNAEPSEVAVVPLIELERRHTLQAIALLGGNKTLAAEMLGIDRRTLRRRLKRYETAASGAHLQVPTESGS